MSESVFQFLLIHRLSYKRASYNRPLDRERNNYKTRPEGRKQLHSKTWGLIVMTLGHICTYWTTVLSLRASFQSGMKCCHIILITYSIELHKNLQKIKLANGS